MRKSSKHGRSGPSSPPHGGLEAGGFGFALGAEPALPARLLDAAAVVVGRSGQHVDAGPAGHQPLDGAAVGGAALGFVPGLGAELARTLHLAGGPDAGLGVAGLPLEAGVARKQTAARERVALAYQLAVDVEPPARTRGQRAPGAVAAAERAGERAAVDEPAEGSLCRRSAAVAPAAGTAGLLVLGSLDAGEPHCRAGHTQQIAAGRFGAALQGL